MKKLVDQYPAHKDFVAKAEIVGKVVVKAGIVLVLVSLIAYQLLFILSYLGLTSYQQYQQERQSAKQQEALQELQQSEE